jgi:hypothetical protein
MIIYHRNPEVHGSNTRETMSVAIPSGDGTRAQVDVVFYAGKAEVDEGVGAYLVDHMGWATRSLGEDGDGTLKQQSEVDTMIDKAFELGILTKRGRSAIVMGTTDIARSRSELADKIQADDPIRKTLADALAKAEPSKEEE